MAGFQGGVAKAVLVVHHRGRLFLAKKAKFPMPSAQACPFPQYMDMYGIIDWVGVGSISMHMLVGCRENTARFPYTAR